MLLLVASYFFYGWWDWRFLSLVAFSTVLDYTMGRLIGAQEDDRKRRWLLWISLGINLAFLGFFKYYNFFVTSWVDAWASVGIHMPDAQYHFALGNQLLHVSEHELFIGRVQGAYAAAQGLFELCHLCQLFPAVGCSRDKFILKHGMCDTHFYTIYKNIRAICDNRNIKRYRLYGGQGIKYRSRWIRSALWGNPYCVDELNRA